jgi:hypothetical protein
MSVSRRSPIVAAVSNPNETRIMNVLKERVIDGRTLVASCRCVQSGRRRSTIARLDGR